MERNSPFSDSSLLSEIHTLFPALLYDHTRFHNLQDVFRYVREQLRARYDIFSNAVREYHTNNQTRENTIITSTSRIPIVIDTIGQVAISDLIRSFLYSGMPEATTGIPAATTSQIPTNEQIENASQDFPYTGAETSCAICQDSIRTNEVVRRLTSCDHIFHNVCLITWFRRHATCPLCRNDIRLVTPSTTTTTTPPLP